MLGYCATGRPNNATLPISTMTIASTLASTGRLMKNFEIIGAIPAGYLAGAAVGAAVGVAAGAAVGVAAGTAMIVGLGATLLPGIALPLVDRTTRSSGARPLVMTRRLQTRSW